MTKQIISTDPFDSDPLAWYIYPITGNKGNFKGLLEMGIEMWVNTPLEKFDYEEPEEMKVEEYTLPTSS